MVVSHPSGDGPMVINRADYNPDLHRPWPPVPDASLHIASSSTTAVSAEAGVDIPDGISRRRRATRSASGE